MKCDETFQEGIHTWYKVSSTDCERKFVSASPLCSEKEHLLGWFKRRIFKRNLREVFFFFFPSLT